ncbi:MAG: PAS domain-containing sensor histidine kinase, partial [Bacillota bacterium]|nr:PAS domain-containing sensor histidine kinase [Bacillota bacterium]
MSEENRKLLDELGLPVEFLGAVPGGFHVCEDSPEEEYPLVYTSERFLEILGWSAEEIKENFDNRYSRMVHPDDKDAGEANYSENLGQADAVTEDRVFRMQGKTGYKWVSSTAKTYEANGKRYVCAIHTAINHIVEESKQENQDLQEEKTEVINDIEILKNQLDIIKSVAGVYICLYYVDLSDYSYIELGTTADDVEELIGKKGEAHVAFEQMCRYLVADEFVDAMKEFTKVETVNDRLKNTNWITRQFIDTKGNWTEGWFIAADRDENGNCKHAVWGVRDISEQKNIELAYQNELEETDNIVANAGMGIWTIQMFDGEEPRMQANPMMRELLSLPEDMIDEVEIYHAWYSRIKPEALESVTASVQAMINGERNENTYLWEDPNLGDQYVRCGGVAEKVDGKGYILRGYHYNVNNEVLKEQQSKIASKKTNAILEAVSSDYHTVWLIDDKTLEMNFIRSSGVKTIQKAVAMGANQANYDSAIHKYIHTYVVDEDRERVEKAVKSATVMQEVERQFVYTVNYKRIDDDGNITFHQMAFAKVEGFGFTLAYRDIDDMMQEELQKQQILETALENAEAASRSKSTFLFNMSHDIRTPMNAIMGFTDLLKKNLDDKEVAESYIRKIQSSNEFLLEIINNILDMARIESGKEELDENPVHSEEVCGEVISIFEAQMAGKDIEFTYDIHVEHDYVYADATKLRK